MQEPDCGGCGSTKPANCTDDAHANTLPMVTQLPPTSAAAVLPACGCCNALVQTPLCLLTTHQRACCM
jgi:hypothetical protein